jgi:hypothetical protein
MSQNCRVVEAIPISINQYVEDGKLGYRFYSKNRIKTYEINHINSSIYSGLLENYEHTKVQRYYLTINFGNKKSKK